jgi:hypothetical protein
LGQALMSEASEGSMLRGSPGTAPESAPPFRQIADFSGVFVGRFDSHTLPCSEEDRCARIRRCHEKRCNRRRFWCAR